MPEQLEDHDTGLVGKYYCATRYEGKRIGDKIHHQGRVTCRLNDNFYLLQEQNPFTGIISSEKYVMPLQNMSIDNEDCIIWRFFDRREDWIDHAKTYVKEGEEGMDRHVATRPGEG
jgi:hypothetical protein